MSHPKYKGFILIRSYPGCNRNLGSFEPYTTGNFIEYPHLWEPVYQESYIRDEKLKQILDDKSI